MTIETELRTRLLADGTISGLIGTRLYPVVLPQDPTMPALVSSRVSGQRLHNLSGVAGRGMPRITIDCWASTYAGSKTLAAAVRSSLDGLNGLLTTINASIKIDNEIDDYEDDTGLYRVIQDYIINHLEA